MSISSNSIESSRPKIIKIYILPSSSWMPICIPWLAKLFCRESISGLLHIRSWGVCSICIRRSFFIAISSLLTCLLTRNAKVFFIILSKDLRFWISQNPHLRVDLRNGAHLGSCHSLVSLPLNALRISHLLQANWCMECWLYYSWATDWEASLPRRIHPQPAREDHWVYRGSVSRKH